METMQGGFTSAQECDKRPEGFKQAVTHQGKIKPLPQDGGKTKCQAEDMHSHLSRQALTMNHFSKEVWTVLKPEPLGECGHAVVLAVAKYKGNGLHSSGLIRAARVELHFVLACCVSCAKACP